MKAWQLLKNNMPNSITLYGFNNDFHRNYWFPIIFQFHSLILPWISIWHPETLTLKYHENNRILSFSELSLFYSINCAVDFGVNILKLSLNCLGHTLDVMYMVHLFKLSLKLFYVYKPFTKKLRRLFWQVQRTMFP